MEGRRDVCDGASLFGRIVFVNQKLACPESRVFMQSRSMVCIVHVLPSGTQAVLVASVATRTFHTVAKNAFFVFDRAYFANQTVSLE